MEIIRFVGCLSGDWKQIGYRLGISHNRITIIESDERRCEDCLNSLVNRWLRTRTDDGKPPSWKRLAEALMSVDPGKAGEIAEKYHCGCAECSQEESKAINYQSEQNHQGSSFLQQHDCM